MGHCEAAQISRWAPLCLCIWALACSVSSHAQVGQPEALTSAAAGQAAQPGPNAITQAVFQRGMLNRTSRVQQFSRFLGFGPEAGAQLMPAAAPADQRLFALQMEVSAGAHDNSFVDMGFAPNQANGCGAAYLSHPGSSSGRFRNKWACAAFQSLMALIGVLFLSAASVLPPTEN